MLLAPDGFTAQATIDEAGAENAAGMYASVAGVPPDELTGAGADFIAAFEESLGGEPIEPYSAYGAQAMQVAIDAVAAGGEDRAAVIEALMATEVTDGILGTFSITEEGDPTSGPITIYIARDTFEAEEVITPSEELVQAAMGG
jgi:branched-chain amino acid transport system substrate-binding protein